MRRITWIVTLLLLLSLGISTTSAQITDLLSIEVEAGYDGNFRTNHWLPLRIEIENQGDPINGLLVVRPQTSGDAIPNTYSTPVDLPTGSNQAFFLYITARSNANLLRVELLNEANNVVGSREFTVRDVLARDRLYAVITQATTQSISLTDANIGGYEVRQADWLVENVPDRTGALEALDVMVFSDVDSGQLSVGQQEAIAEWVQGGGHLIVTGGPAWQSTAAAFTDLLPLQPAESDTIDDLTALAELGGDYETTLTGDVIVAQGELSDDARVIVADPDGIPLVVRRELGNGTVDYLAVDPGSQPLRQWANVNSLWFSLLSSTDAQPSWTHGFSNWELATDAVEILPGIDLLPAILGLILFLVAYVVLIGPVNYLVLSRLNKREYAWVTIPILIVVFSALAWAFGFELRGNQATLSRISIVQTWPDSEEAQIDQLLGLLAPRRDTYTLSMADDRMMRPISASLANPNALGSGLDTDIRESTQFEAVDFSVDASFIAAFKTTGTTERPDIGGRFTLIQSDNGTQTFQGAIRNDSDLILTNPVILTRGGATYLGGPLEPGDVRTFNGSELLVDGVEGTQGASPSPLEYVNGDTDPFLTSSPLGFQGGRSDYLSASTDTAQQILGEEDYVEFNFGVSFSDDPETQESRRRQAFLDAFVLDQYASTGRGNSVYLLGWTTAAPTTEEVQGAGFDVVDTTLYVVELAVEREASAGDVLITQDQFTWISREREGISDIGPNSLMLATDSQIVFRFTPLADAMLDEVTELTIVAERVRNTFSNNIVEIWNWRTREWEAVDLETEERFTFTDPAPYLGPQNAVELRAARDEVVGSVFIERLGVEQRGEF